MFLNVNANVLYCSTFEITMLQLKRVIVSLNVGNIAHQLKTYDILPQQRASHTQLTY